jgi:hypothetical protein
MERGNVSRDSPRRVNDAKLAAGAGARVVWLAIIPELFEGR